MTRAITLPGRWRKGRGEGGIADQCDARGDRGASGGAAAVRHDGGAGAGTRGAKVAGGGDWIRQVAARTFAKRYFFSFAAESFPGLLFDRFVKNGEAKDWVFARSSDSDRDCGASALLFEKRVEWLQEDRFHPPTACESPAFRRS